MAPFGHPLPLFSNTFYVIYYFRGFFKLCGKYLDAVNILRKFFCFSSCSQRFSNSIKEPPIGDDTASSVDFPLLMPSRIDTSKG